jgi:hypothetical protein
MKENTVCDENYFVQIYEARKVLFIIHSIILFHTLLFFLLFFYQIEHMFPHLSFGSPDLMSYWWIALSAKKIRFI